MKNFIITLIGLILTVSVYSQSTPIFDYIGVVNNSVKMPYSSKEDKIKVVISGIKTKHFKDHPDQFFRVFFKDKECFVAWNSRRKKYVLINPHNMEPEYYYTLQEIKNIIKNYFKI